MSWWNLIALGKAAYDIWKKEGESKERVKATPGVTSCDSVEVVGVELYNPESTPAAIKRVALVVKTETGELSEALPSESEAAKLDNNYFQEASTLPESVSRLKLGPKEHARFHLDRHTERTVGWLLKQPAGNFWIVVESFRGEVARVSGKQIQVAILKTPYGRAIRAVDLKLREMNSVNASS
jgi:hypothetical protein